MTAPSPLITVVDQWADPRWRLNNIYSCLDESGKKVPFRLNTSQNRLFDNLWYFNLVLKARQMGFTTFIDLIGLDQALFTDNWMTGICAHTREDAEKIFEKKVRFPYDDLPDGLKSARSADTDSAKKLKFSNGSSIEVGTSLRSGTYQFVHVSEFGKICAHYPDKAKELVTGTFETVHPGSYLFIESTAEGRNGAFYRMVMDAQKRQQEKRLPVQLQFKLHFFPWYEDVRNTIDPHAVPIPREMVKYLDDLERALGIVLSAGQRAWYTVKSETLGDDMKREHPSTVEEAFEVAVAGAYLSKQMGFLRGKGRITEVPHDPNFVVNTAWDFGINDRMCIWLHQYVGLQHRMIGYLSGTDDDVLYYWRELQKLPYSWGRHFLPHDAKARRIGSAEDSLSPPRTIEKILNDAGARDTVVVPRVDDKFTAISEVRLFLPGVWIDSTECTEGIKCLDGFRREWDETAGDWKNRPCHNWAMHGYDSFETLVRGLSTDGNEKNMTPIKTEINRGNTSWR